MNPRAEMPASAGRILDARSLATSHRRLADLLKPGMRVLDAGCGTGAITRDVAAVVEANGLVVGGDISDVMLTQATQIVRPSLRFVRADLFALPFRRCFDIVTAARVLQWVNRPLDAVRELATAVKPGGVLLVLDYDHERIQWTPAPPVSMQRFYAAFLRWRAEAGMDNAIAVRLPSLFRAAGLVDVRVTPQQESTQRGDDDFAIRAGIWADVAASRGHQMVRDGAISESERASAESDCRAWVENEAIAQTLHLFAVEGVSPAANTLESS